MRSLKIVKHLNKKFNDFLLNIEDEEIRRTFEQNTIITGGAISNLLESQTPNDYDVYIRTSEAAIKIATYYLEKFKQLNPDIKIKNRSLLDSKVVFKEDRIAIVIPSCGIVSESTKDKYEFFECQDPSMPTQEEFFDSVVECLKSTPKEKGDKTKYRPKYLTSNAITLSDDIQICLRFYGEPEKIHESFDFVHCMNYWTSWNNVLVLKPEAMESQLAKDLVYNGSQYPIAALVRSRKYIKRGWNINAGQYLKMAFQISKLDLTNVGILQDQLLGVDVAYFLEIIHKLAENDKTLDYTYIAELVDTVF